MPRRSNFEPPWTVPCCGSICPHTVADVVHVPPVLPPMPSSTAPVRLCSCSAQASARAGASPDAGPRFERVATIAELDQRLEGHARRRLTCWYSTHEFMEDFSVHLQSESWLQAVDGPPWAVSYERGSDDAHFQGFAPLRLRVLGGQKERELPWLPVRDAPSNKRFLVFFVPPLQPGQEPYRVVVDCNLPGAAGTLRLPNAQDEYIVRVPDSLTESVPEFKLIVRMRAEKGDFELSCQIKGRSFCQTPGEMRSRQFGGPSRQGDSSASRSCANDDSGCLNR